MEVCEHLEAARSWLDDEPVDTLLRAADGWRLSQPPHAEAQSSTVQTRWRERRAGIVSEPTIYPLPTNWEATAEGISDYELWDVLRNDGENAAATRRTAIGLVAVLLVSAATVRAVVGSEVDTAVYALAAFAVLAILYLVSETLVLRETARLAGKRS